VNTSNIHQEERASASSSNAAGIKGLQRRDALHSAKRRIAKESDPLCITMLAAAFSCARALPHASSTSLVASLRLAGVVHRDGVARSVGRWWVVVR